MTDLASAPLTNGAPHWELPLAVILALPTGSVMRALIQNRRNRGDRPKPIGQLFTQEGQFFALVDFYGEDRPGILYPLDVWDWGGPETKRGRG